MKFFLEIELENSEMRNSHQLAKALSEVGLRISRHNYVKIVRDENSDEDFVRGIKDSNGNTVGSWKLNARK